MRAALYHRHHTIHIQDIPPPNPKTTSQVLVDVAWTGICGSDLHEYTLGPLLVSTTPHPLTGECLPLALGHELCGHVRNPPPSSGLKDGEAVMVDPRIRCGECGPCGKGDSACCERLGYVGGSTGGGFAEQVVVEAGSLHPLGSIPVEFAAVIEPLAVVHHAVQESGVSDWRGKCVLVLGGGPIGFALLLVLRAHGATNVVVSEPAGVRRRMVAEFADAVIDPVAEDVVERCRELSGGKGVDVVFDCAGVPAGLAAGFEALAFHGNYVMVAVWEKPMEVPCAQLLFKHITFKGVAIFSTEDFKEVMEWMQSGRIKGYERMVTRRIGIEDIVEKGFEALVNERDQHIKILVTPRKELLQRRVSASHRRPGNAK